jgi:hypothetical protein
MPAIRDPAHFVIVDINSTTTLDPRLRGDGAVYARVNCLT